MRMVDLVAIPLGIPLGQELQPGLNTELGTADPLAVADLDTFSRRLRVVLGIVSNRQRVSSDHVKSVVARMPVRDV